MIFCSNTGCNNKLSKEQSRYGRFCSLKCAGLAINSVSGALRYKRNRDAYNQQPKLCNNTRCNKPISYEKRQNQFCSQSCSAKTNNMGRIDTTQTRSKKSTALAGRPNFAARKGKRLYKSDIFGPYSKVYFKRCKATDALFATSRPRQTYASKSIQESVQLYRKQCYFRFNIKDYSDRIDCRLLEQHGMYHPIANPRGAVRDHMVSVADGFKHNIDPAIINHPANCQILLQPDNQKKGAASCIAIDELLERIKNWT